MKENDLIRTTVYLPRRLLRSAKITAALSNSSVSHLIRIGLQEKISLINKKPSPKEGRTLEEGKHTEKPF